MRIRGNIKQILRRAGRIARAIMLILAAVIVCAYLAEFARGFRLEPTGDALFDTYARAVRNRQAWRLFTGGGMHPATLPDTTLARWEKRFGADPRYWELRYWCARNSGLSPFASGCLAYPANWFSKYQQQPAQPSCLAKAMELGSPAAFYFNYQEHEIEQRRGEYEADYELDHPARKVDRAKWIEYHKQQERDEMGLLTAMAAESPDYAWAHYPLARFYFELGEMESGSQELRAGNNAARNEIPTLFPATFVLDRIAEDKRCGSEAIAGGVLEVGANQAHINIVKWREVAKETELAFVMTGDLGSLDAVHSFFAREGNARYAGSVEQMAAAGSLREPASYLLEQGSDFGPQQRGVLLGIVKRCDQVLLAGQSFAYVEVTTNPALTAAYFGNMSGFFGQDPLGILPNGYWKPALSLQVADYVLFPSRRFRAIAAAQRKYHDFSSRQLERALNELGEVQIATLEWPNSWGSPSG